MERKRFPESQIVSILKEADAETKVKIIFRRQGITDARYYNWKSKYCGMSASELNRLKNIGTELSK